MKSKNNNEIHDITRELLKSVMGNKIELHDNNGALNDKDVDKLEFNNTRTATSIKTPKYELMLYEKFFQFIKVCVIIGAIILGVLIPIGFYITAIGISGEEVYTLFKNNGGINKSFVLSYLLVFCCLCKFIVFLIVHIVAGIVVLLVIIGIVSLIKRIVDYFMIKKLYNDIDNNYRSIKRRAQELDEQEKNNLKKSK
jgi:hypothetical protein